MVRAIIVFMTAGIMLATTTRGLHAQSGTATNCPGEEASTSRSSVVGARVPCERGTHGATHGHDSGVVFQQDFQGSTSVSGHVSATDPGTGQFDDISAEATGGTFHITQGRLQLVRAGSSEGDNDAGISRWTDLAGPPTTLHLSFDVGVSDWTAAPFQTGAMLLSVGNRTGFSDYGSGEVAISNFHTLGVKGEGPGQFVIMAGGGRSPLLAANGTLHRVELFLNRSGAAATYRGPDGALRKLRNNGVALWVNGAAVVVDADAGSGSESTLTDLRIRWSSADNGTWTLDNFLIRSAFPQ